MFRIADQPLIDRIDYPIEHLQGDLADKNRTLVGYFGNLAHAFSALDDELDRIEYTELLRASCCACGARLPLLKSELVNSPARQ